jgi:hypothetical protein
VSPMIAFRTRPTWNGRALGGSLAVRVPARMHERERFVDQRRGVDREVDVRSLRDRVAKSRRGRETFDQALGELVSGDSCPGRKAVQRQGDVALGAALDLKVLSKKVCRERNSRGRASL